MSVCGPISAENLPTMYHCGMSVGLQLVATSGRSNYFTKITTNLLTSNEIDLTAILTWLKLVIPPETKFRGGILDSPCSSVRLSVCPSVRPSVRPWVGVRMITLILFSGFKNFFYIYHLGQDLAWDWISASYLIKYAHTGRSCDLLIFGIPEVNFLVRAFQFGMKGVLSRIYDISPGFCWIPIFVFFLNFLPVS